MVRIMFDALKLHRAILELRHSNAYLFWDFVGRCTSEINKISQGKIEFKEMKGNECVLKFSDNLETQASFGLKHITMTGSSLKNIRIFHDYADTIYGVVREKLQIAEISRAGFRFLYVIKTKSEKEAEEFVADLELVEVDAKRFESFGSEVLLLQPTIRINDGGMFARIIVNSAKRIDADEPEADFDEYNPAYAILLDIDFYRKNIKASELNISEFVHSCEKKVKEHIAEIINK